MGGLGHLPGHDAFRRAKGSLRLHYPLLSLLGDEPIALEALAAPLAVHRDKVSSMANRLVDVGVASLDERGLRLAVTPQQLHARLNDVAAEVGTYGQRARAQRRYRERAAVWAAERAEFARQRNEVGSEVWFKEEKSALRAVFEDPACEALVNSWREVGMNLDDLVTYVVDAQTRRPNWNGPHRV